MLLLVRNRSSDVLRVLNNVEKGEKGSSPPQKRGKKLDATGRQNETGCLTTSYLECTRGSDSKFSKRYEDESENLGVIDTVPGRTRLDDLPLFVGVVEVVRSVVGVYTHSGRICRSVGDYRLCVRSGPF